MARAGLWIGGLVGSACVHAAAFGLYVATRSLEPPPEQPGPQSKLQMDTVSAETQDAEAQTPDAETADASDADSTAVDAGAIKQSTAQSVDTQSAKVDALQSSGDTLAAAQQSGQTVDAATPETQSTKASDASGASVTSQTPTVQSAPAASATVTPTKALSARVETAAASTVSATAIAPQTPVTAASTPITTPSATAVTSAVLPVELTSAATPAPTTSTAPATLAAQSAQTARPDANDITQSAPDAETAVQSADTGTDLASANTQGDVPNEPALPAENAKANLAWQFGDRLVTDPQALATIQAFMTPNAAASSADVKDDLSSVLTGIDCARLSATFLPESGTLEMRGHIPDPALRGPILEALQKQVGDGIPVTANLLHLPAPQCGALTGIANVGLPQSTDQFTNDRLIGATAHAREYSYSEGQRLQFDLGAPDYDAFVYVDYFNAEGEVIHLVPNETVALEQTKEKEQFAVGSDRGDKPSLVITIGPPFGQEIAVAFAASEPLYDGLRPIVEPAEPYLEWLQGRVTAAREANPDFKGEWVYFFITTTPATQ